MDFDEWAELASEAPGGENHGRRKGGDGGWQRMDRAAQEFIDLGLEYVFDVEVHGTRSTYQAGCHCHACRRANRDYVRARRLRNAPVRLQEPRSREDSPNMCSE